MFDAALAALARREKSPARMEDALTCMGNAVEVYQQVGDGNRLLIAQKNITRMKAELDKHETLNIKR